MSQPQWVTPAGSLGTIRERIAYSKQLVTTNADGSQTVKYKLQFGTLPPGLSISSAGVISGNPQNVVTANTSTFIIRAYTPDAFNDRSFSITVVNNPIMWTTPVGNLGTLPENIFYSVQLEAATVTTPSQTVKYELISGLLPSGLYIDSAGLIAGVPRAVIDIAGVPTEVSQDVTSKFAIRAFTETTIGGRTVIDGINDRTFTFTVSGAGAPKWITPAGVIAEYLVGTMITDLSVLYTDANTNDNVKVTLFAGELPPGTTVDEHGVFGGYIGLNPGNNGDPGYSVEQYDVYPMDFTQTVPTITYQFVLAVSNGYSTDLRTFEITANSTSMFTADTTLITADNTYFTADVSSIITPFITTPVGSIGTVRNDNFFAFQFSAIDVYDNTLGWEALTTLPPGLALDVYTGWLYGYLPDLGITDLTFDFTIRVFEIGDPTVTSNPYDYSLTVQGAIASSVTWLTPSNLGSIDNGSTSTFYVKAINTLGYDLFYQLDSGSLPPGLTLSTSGDIIGQVSFQTFTIDSGTTTFDVTNPNPYYNVNSLPTSGNSSTTFDLTYTFRVEAYSLPTPSEILVYKTFTILVNRVYNEPYENLYIKAMPPFDSRALINELITDTNIFTTDLIYRPTDPNFGVATDVTYWHAYGLTAATYEKYVESLALNHYWKNLTFGTIKTARAVDPTTEATVYEVVYSEIVDNLVNPEGATVDKIVTLAYPINPNTVDEIDNVYPNGLVDMRDQVIDVVGQESNILPLWMQSEQANGQILGFTPAWVIAYCQPGAANHVAYNIATQYGDKLNQVDFEVDRYELDRALTFNWKPAATYTIANIVGNGSNATVSYNPYYANAFFATEAVSIANVDPAGYNGNSVVSSATYGNVIIPSTESGTYISGGNISNFGEWLSSATGNTYQDIHDKYLVFPKRNILE